jgi:acetyl esterase/lipase
MSYGYLITVVALAALTLCTLAPPRRPWALAIAVYVLTIAANELPFLAIAYLLASTGLALSDGLPDSPVGLAGAGLAALTLVGLGLVVRRGLQTRAVVDAALARALGPQWSSTVDERLTAGLRRGRPWGRILLRPFFRRRHDVRRVANLRYGDAGRRNLLDVYHHRSRPRGGPVLIHWHGGYYRGGHKDSQSLPLLYRLASQGWVCISANYRLRPAAGFAEHLADAKKVIAWAHQHAHEYGADSGVVFVSGSSAGAHIAALAALTPNDPRLQPGIEGEDTSVTAAVCLGGYLGYYFDRPPGYEPPSSPQAYVRRDAPPFFVAHGQIDTMVPVESARQFVDALRDVSASPVVYAELPGGQHGFDLFHSPRFEAVIDGIEAFAAWSGHGPHRRVSGPRL